MSLHKSYFLQVLLCLYSQEILSHHNLNVTYQHRLAVVMLALWELWCVGGEGSGDRWCSAPLPRTASRLHPHCSARRGRAKHRASKGHPAAELVQVQVVALCCKHTAPFAEYRRLGRWRGCTMVHEVVRLVGKVGNAKKMRRQCGHTHTQPTDLVPTSSSSSIIISINMVINIITAKSPCDQCFTIPPSHTSFTITKRQPF